MTDKLTPVSWNRFVSRMKKLGFSGPFFGGKHPKMRKCNLTIIIPNKHESEIGVGFLRRLLNQAEVTGDRFQNNLMYSVMSGKKPDDNYGNFEFPIH